MGKPAGWHFSFFGNANTVREKIAAYDECQNNDPEITNNMEEKMQSNKDPLNRNITLTTVPIDESYPEYIQNNREKYVEFIKPWN